MKVSHSDGSSVTRDSRIVVSHMPPDSIPRQSLLDDHRVGGHLGWVSAELDYGTMPITVYTMADHTPSRDCSGREHDLAASNAHHRKAGLLRVVLIALRQRSLQWGQARWVLYVLGPLFVAHIGVSTALAATHVTGIHQEKLALM